MCSLEVIEKITPTITDLRNKKKKIFKKLEELSKKPGNKNLDVGPKPKRRGSLENYQRKYR